MIKTNLRSVNICTTAFYEENFTIVTSLSDDEIINVIKPIVKLNRSDSTKHYDNDDFILNLRIAYPDKVVNKESNIHRIII